jgi:inorganic pyrophosphatase
MYDLDPGPAFPVVVRMVVEIPKGSSNKYEYDHELGAFRLDRVLYSPVHYPGDYGFIPGTLASDGDPMDVMALVEEPTFTGCIVEVRPVGVLNMDQKAGRETSTLGWGDPIEARTVIAESRKAYLAHRG